MFVLGGEHGSVHLVDLRLPPQECLTSLWMTEQQQQQQHPPGSTSSSLHNHAVLSARLRHDRTIVAGYGSGRIKFWDIRSRAQTKTVDITANDVATVDIHPNLPYFGM